MKKIILLFTFGGMFSCHMYGIKEIDPETINTIKTKLKEFHKPTMNLKDPKPDLLGLLNKHKCILIAKLDSFGINRYFTFDIKQELDVIVLTIQNGGAQSISWYTLSPENLDLKTLEKLLGEPNPINAHFSLKEIREKLNKPKNQPKS